MALEHFNKETFDEALGKGELMMVDFWAEWCGPCKMLGPVIDQLAQEYEGKAVIGKVNVDEEPELARQYRIMSIPTLMVFRSGELVRRETGGRSKEEIIEMLDLDKATV